jgi:hypothetical protein
MPLLVISSSVLIWVGMWALLSRIFSASSRFLRNLLIALAGLLVASLFGEFAQFAAFAWTWSAAATYEYAVTWLILAATCFLHLREVGSSHLLLKGALVTALLITAIAVQTLQLSEAFSASGRQNIARQLMPPAFRAVSPRDQIAFFGEIADLKATLDDDRRRAKPNEAGR